MKVREKIWVPVLALALCGSTALAQNQNQQNQQDQTQGVSPIDPNAPLQPLEPAPTPGYPNRPPIGVVRGASTPAAAQPQAYDPSQVTPDQNTLAGAAPFSLGSLQHTRNTFDPSISVSQLGQTLPLSDGQSIVTGVTVAGGSLNFDRTWSGYHLSTIYNGGETFNFGYNNTGTAASVYAPHYQFHELAFTQEAIWGRWHILIRDDFMASPGAAFTGQGMGGPGLAAQFSSMLGSGLNSLAQSFLPSETINTGQAMRLRNALLGQAEYSFSRRSAFTMSASYGLLHFDVPGFFNSTMLDAQAGYDYLLSPANSIAILGSYGRIDYSGTSSNTTDYVGAIAFGRKITGRLAFQIAAGPQEIQSSGTAGLGNFNFLFASVNSALKYERRRGGVSLSFVRGLTGGSGVFQGATSNTASANAHYQFTRFWTASINGGYALNNSLARTGTPTIQFDDWFVGANLGRRVGLHAQVNFNYGATMQNNPGSICSVALCGVTGLQQTVGMSVNWHLRPSGY